MGRNLGQWIDMGLTGLFVLTGAFMTFFILLQEGKGGGLTALGGTKAAGVEGVTNPIRRATVYMAALFFVLAIILGRMHRPQAAFTIGPGTGTSGGATPDLRAEAVPPEGVKTSMAPPPKPEADTKQAAPKTLETKTIEIKTPDAKTGEVKTEAVKTPEPAAKKAENPPEPPKAEPRKEEGKKDEPKKDEGKKAEEPKKDEAKKADEPKNDETKKADEAKK